MPSVKTNIIANLTGRIWSAALTLALIPLYVKFLGIEAYGLIGFYTTLLASLLILDLGLSTTLNRELARAKAMKKAPSEVRNLVFTLECIYWGLGFVLAAAVAFFAPLIAKHWINTQSLSVDDVATAIRLMGAVIAFQWPISIYNGGLLGLEKQVQYNVIMIVMSTSRAAGILVLFLFVRPSLELFFIWQACLSFLYVATMRMSLWWALPPAVAAVRFSKSELKNIWRFASGMTGIGITAFLLAQIDKIVLSKLLLLTQYGYYTLAFALTASLGTLVGPIYMAVFPRISALEAQTDHRELEQLYFTYGRLVSAVAFSVGLFIFFFAPEILLAWTHTVETVDQTVVLVRVLVVAQTFSCLMTLPTALLQAKGNTSFLFWQNGIATIVLLPLLFYWTKHFGAVGATFVILSLYTSYLFVSIPLITHRYLPGNVLRYYTNALLYPVLTATAFFFIARWLADKIFVKGSLPFIVLAVIGASGLAVSLLVLPDSRRWLQDFRTRAVRNRAVDAPPKKEQSIL